MGAGEEWKGKVKDDFRSPACTTTSMVVSFIKKEG